MAVISISIERSQEEIISGIPKTITLSTNTPSTIFYTIDGTEPDLFSDIYVSKIFLPKTVSYLVLKIMATNGIDSSPVLSQEYFTNLVGKNVREFGKGTTEPPSTYKPNLFPFGTNSPLPEVIFDSSTADHQAISDGINPEYSNAFDADGYQTNFTKLPYNKENYQIKYDLTDRRGKRYLGVGTLPATSTLLLEKEPPDETIQFSKTFDPKAMVIFQNLEDENPDDPPQINKQFFTLDKLEKTKDGGYFFVAGNEVQAPTGSFLRSHYNPRTNDINYYYFDSKSLKWIISTQQYYPSATASDNFAGHFMSRGQGVGKVFKWIPGMHRYLF